MRLSCLKTIAWQYKLWVGFKIQDQLKHLYLNLLRDIWEQNQSLFKWKFRMRGAYVLPPWLCFGVVCFKTFQKNIVIPLADNVPNRLWSLFHVNWKTRVTYFSSSKSLSKDKFYQLFKQVYHRLILCGFYFSKKHSVVVHSSPIFYFPSGKDILHR